MCIEIVRESLKICFQDIILRCYNLAVRSYRMVVIKTFQYVDVNN